MKKINLVLILLLVIFIIGCSKQTYTQNSNNIQEQNQDVVAKLTNIERATGNVEQFSGYYEGKLSLQDVNSGKIYSIFACSKDWSWVKQDYCYKFNPSEVDNNVQSHMYSAELSGCYIGTLQQVNC